MVDECVFYIDDVMILPTLMTESSWVCQTNNLRVSHLNSMTLVLTIDQEDQGYSVNSVGIDIHKHEMFPINLPNKLSSIISHKMLVDKANTLSQYLLRQHYF